MHYAEGYVYVYCVMCMAKIFQAMFKVSTQKSFGKYMANIFQAQQYYILICSLLDSLMHIVTHIGTDLSLVLYITQTLDIVISLGDRCGESQCGF